MEKNKTEEFVEKAVAVHGDVYDYSLTCYVKSKEKVIIACKLHGDYTIAPNSHLAGQGCKACGVESRASKQRGSNELFLKKAKETHGDRYDYSKVNYFNISTEVQIICSKHGSFLQTPKIHYKSGCPNCALEKLSEVNRKGTDRFIQQAIEKYGNKYDYSLVDYINCKTPVKIILEGEILEVKPEYFLSKTIQRKTFKKITKSTNKELFLKEVESIYGDKNDYTNTIVGNSRGKIDVVCKEHGEFTVYMQNHFKGQGCPQCSAINYSKIRTKTTKEFIQLAKEVHKNDCDYTDTLYISSREKVKIKCNIHNEYFEILPSNHLTGTKCKKCFSENQSKLFKGREGTCGYTRSGYVKQANGREACVYLIKCFSDNNEFFYKIGKTFLDITKRFTKSNICYNFEVTHLHFGEAGYIYDLENELHRQYKKYKYKPNNWFAGYTECYNLFLPIEEIISKHE